MKLEKKNLKLIVFWYGNFTYLCNQNFLYKLHNVIYNIARFENIHLFWGLKVKMQEYKQVGDKMG